MRVIFHSMKPIRRIQLRRGDHARLTQIRRSRLKPQRLVERATIVLEAATGKSSYEIAAELGVSRPTIRRCLDRYEAEGIKGIKHDRARSGRPKRITSDVEAEIIDKTRKSAPPDGGTHWSTRLMAREVGLHQTTISRIWRAHGLQPHRIEYFKLSQDPFFIEKLRSVVGLYFNPPQHAVVFAVDEKSQMQALDRTQPGLPMKKGRAGTMTHDYKRHGTTTLFAALEVATGRIEYECMPRHRHQEFLHFLRKIERTVPEHLDIYVILDNASAHKHRAVQRWLEKHPRVMFSYVPTSGSWLNLVERFFAELSTRKLRRLVVHSLNELIAAVSEYIDKRNQNPKPFIWTATVESILEKVRRGHRTLASHH